ncbi:hypothetical protein AVEN_128861-1 [Araneus ventricosus]|uniref:Uncharacterized protein n=1 Tax=Araneus ventricosus TaxID=182803 RepID=A0A4Y2EYL1_ARAVE|nr:hypothetical protein AVEN_128861-1 [Araneus ventricosus]
MKNCTIRCKRFGIVGSDRSRWTSGIAWSGSWGRIVSGWGYYKIGQCPEQDCRSERRVLFYAGDELLGDDSQGLCGRVSVWTRGHAISSPGSGSVL